ERALDLRLIARQLRRRDPQRADRDREQNDDDAGRGQHSAQQTPDDALPRPHISTTSYWSGAYIVSACSLLGLPVSSSSSATVPGSSSSSRSMTSGRASTRSSWKSN